MTNPKLLDLVSHQRQATQLLSLGKYTPHLISYGCIKRLLNISYQHKFCSNRKELQFFIIGGASEKLKNLFFLPRSVHFVEHFKSILWPSPFELLFLSFLRSHVAEAILFSVFCVYITLHSFVKVPFIIECCIFFVQILALLYFSVFVLSTAYNAVKVLLLLLPDCCC